MKDDETVILIRVPAPKPGNPEKLDLSFLRETVPRSEEERHRPMTREEIDALVKALCPPSLRTEEDG